MRALRAAAALTACLAVLSAQAQVRTVPALITAPIDARTLTVLRGNTRPEATPANERARVADTEPLAHLQLLLNRSSGSSRALVQFIDSLHDRASPNYRNWLTPAQLAQRFGPATADIAAVTRWLTSQGFTVNGVSPSGMVIDFSGNAGQVAAAFHTQLHHYVVNGVTHIANATDPQLPSALAPAVRGIVSLHDFFPRPRFVPRAQYTTTGGSTLLAPADLATIYSLSAPFAAGLTGAGQTIAVVEDTDIFSASDWTTFRTTFGLAGYTTGALMQTHPAPGSGGKNCSDPHVLSNGDDGEAILDAEWASASAPGAIIEVASCRNTSTTFGGLIALQNLLDASAGPPSVVSISYGECEALQGATANAAFSAAYEQAVAEGVSVFVAAGDEGAASCDARASNATHGIGVSGMASTAFNVAVGGTDFGDTFADSVSSYWSSGNSSTFGSALSYVPEIPWNDSCASALLASFEGFAAGFGSSGLCNSSQGAGNVTTAAGSGGPSGCASGAPTVSGVVGGSCAGTTKPSWQSGVAGIAADGVRDVPDVSLFSGNGVWGHYYVFCWSDTAQTGGKRCTGAPSGWSGAGGTSFASPILAGIQALIDQASGSRQGNPDYVYYRLAGIQAALNCNATTGSAINPACIFHDVTQGDMAVNCTGNLNCFLPSGTYGQLSSSNTASAPAFAATPGWDFATGLGSVNAANLINAWNDSDLSLSGTSSMLSGGRLSYSLTVTDNGPQNATAVDVTSTLPPGMSLITAGSSSGCSQSGPTLTCSVGALALGGTATLTVILQPGNSSASQLSFLAQSSTPEVDPGDGILSFALNQAAAPVDTDGPLPPWAFAGLSILLAGLATRRRAA